METKTLTNAVEEVLGIYEWKLKKKYAGSIFFSMSVQEVDDFWSSGEL